ncbi:MAG TPA: cytochrome c oxidase assembly factor Coa1 family protein [Longimicrobiales bacterium]|nr:cytochrome c oxidase assembly factor Coa1 family protein [Longimicrobiales bacterium]
MSETDTPGWWSRNWKLAVPLGCLTLVLLGVGLLAAIMMFIKSAGPFEEALELASANCAVEQALGSPLTAGWIVSGSVNVSGPSGNAAVSFPVEGSRGSGRLHAVAYKQVGRWEFERLQLEVEDGAQHIDVLAPRNERCEPQPEQALPKTRKP